MPEASTPDESEQLPLPAVVQLPLAPGAKLPATMTPATGCPMFTSWMVTLAVAFQLRPEREALPLISAMATVALAGSPNLLLFSLAAGVASEPPKPTVAIAGISGAASRSGRNWKATATVTIQDVNSKQPVANVTVAGSFAPGASGSCVTGGNGSCAISSGVLAPSVTLTQFTVTGVAGNVNYDPNSNWGTQITIS